MTSLATTRGQIHPTLSKTTFPTGESRMFANIHLPTLKAFDEVFWQQNERNAPPVAEGRYAISVRPQSSQQQQQDNRLAPPEDNRYVGSGRSRFTTMPVKHKGGADFAPVASVPIRLPSQANNFYPFIKSPIDTEYEQSYKRRFNQPLSRDERYNVKMTGPIQRPIGALQTGGSYAPMRHHGGSNPAINNVFPGTRIPEPLRTYEYSSAYQFHSRPASKDRFHVQYPVSLGRDRISMDDGKSLRSTADLLNQGQFRHISHNPLPIRG